MENTSDNINNPNDIYNPIMKRFEPNKIIYYDEDKHRINNRWCDYMAFIFEKYRDEFEETRINVPETSGNILKKNGVKIDGITQEAIYKGFDIIIQDEEHIEDYLKKQRGKYSQDMPF